MTNTKDQQGITYRIGQILGVLIILGLPVGIIWGLITAWSFFTHLTPQDWGTLGEIARNTSGLIALISAIFTIRIMHRTNMTRAREATSAEFRDQMQWAAESLASNDPIKMTYAQMLLQRYAEDKPQLLDERDHQLVVGMWNLSRVLYGEETDETLEDKDESGQNEDK